MTEPADLIAALASFPHPAQPVDGDCIAWANRITVALQQSGFPEAQTVLVAGWADRDATVLLFAHQATMAGDWVADFTARQFAPELPARWVGAIASYAGQLEAATGAARVDVLGGAIDSGPAEGWQRLTEPTDKRRTTGWQRDLPGGQYLRCVRYGRSWYWDWASSNRIVHASGRCGQLPEAKRAAEHAARVEPMP